MSYLVGAVPPSVHRVVAIVAEIDRRIPGDDANESKGAPLSDARLAILEKTGSADVVELVAEIRRLRAEVAASDRHAEIISRVERVRRGEAETMSLDEVVRDEALNAVEE